MTVKTNLDLKGIIRAYPVAEVILEICQAGLSGSLRVESGEKKAVLYFIDGAAAYAVSNERKFRLAQVLLSQGLVERDYIVKNRLITSDLELAEKIESDGIMTMNELKSIVSAQCESIIDSAVTWAEGEWIFSPHARLKAGVNYDVDLRNLLLMHARDVSPEIAAERLANPNEWFSRSATGANEALLSQDEAYLLSRLDLVPITLNQIMSMVGDAIGNVVEPIYSLWLGGFIARQGWPAAFSEERVAYLRSAQLELKKKAKSFVRAATEDRKVEKAAETLEHDTVDESVPFDLEDCLQRIEGARNSYEVLGILQSAKVDVIRKAYYRLAKVLHPDRYRKETPELLRRIEKAFTELAQAYESIKTPEARHNYDLKIRQEERDRPTGDDISGDGGQTGDMAASDFERGFALQLEGEFEAAVPFLARAAYYSPKNARYHAYYGKALSADDKQRHKAEKELATAVKMEPENASFRLMLAEFFIKYKLMKRAEGELNRLLEISPGNKDALKLLDRLQLN